MSSLRGHALCVAESELRRRRGLDALADDQRRAVDALAVTVAVRVADALEAAAVNEPVLARALAELAARVEPRAG